MCSSLSAHRARIYRPKRKKDGDSGIVNHQALGCGPPKGMLRKGEGPYSWCWDSRARQQNNRIFKIPVNGEKVLLLFGPWCFFSCEPLCEILTRRAYCGFGKANTDQDAAAESMGC
jgi:hypothetical protein